MREYLVTPEIRYRNQPVMVSNQIPQRLSALLFIHELGVM